MKITKVAQIEPYDVCEKCGGELGTKLVGDESYDYCEDCNWITN